MPDLNNRKTRLFIDGNEVGGLRGISSSISSSRKYMTIETMDLLPTEGRHVVRVVMPDGTEMEGDFQVHFEENKWSGKWESRFFSDSPIRKKDVDSL